MSLKNNEPTPTDASVELNPQTLADYAALLGLSSSEEVTAFMIYLLETTGSSPIELEDFKDLEGINFPEIPTEGEQG